MRFGERQELNLQAESSAGALGQLEILRLHGSFYEIGYAHGSRAAGKVARTVAYYEEKIGKSWGKTWEEIRELAMDYYSVAVAHFPELMEEMQGIADGAGVDRKDILAVNAHYELGRRAKARTGGCSVLGVTPSAAGNGCTYLAENWDYGLDQQENMLFLEIREPDGLCIVMVTEAGIIGRMGFNSAGIGYCGNTLRNDFTDKKIPVHLMKRLILRQHSIDEAIRLVEYVGIGSSYNLMIGSAQGCVVDIEADACVQKKTVCREGWLWHTNHFLDEELRRNQEYVKYEPLDSLRRYEAVRMELAGVKQIGEEDIFRVLKNHAGYPDSICRHPNENEPQKERSATLASLVMNLDQRKMYVTTGCPCSGTYMLYQMAL